MLAFNAYSEGWALYAEQLADELGVYDDFPAGRLGYLQGIAFRACRLVVDTGLHHKRWTREQGVRFFVDENGSKPEEVASEVDRYCSWPGQACGYKIGHSEIVRQRARAQAALGPRYDLETSTTRWSRAATCRWTCWPRTSTNISAPPRLERTASPSTGRKDLAQIEARKRGGANGTRTCDAAAASW